MHGAAPGPAARREDLEAENERLRQQLAATRREHGRRMQDLRRDFRDARSGHDWLTCERDEARADLHAMVTAHEALRVRLRELAAGWWISGTDVVTCRRELLAVLDGDS